MDERVGGVERAHLHAGKVHDDCALQQLAGRHSEPAAIHVDEVPVQVDLQRGRAAVVDLSAHFAAQDRPVAIELLEAVRLEGGQDLAET